MNKAFTKESDEEPEEPDEFPRSAQLPSGTPNYTTTDGVARMRDELERLTNIDAPAAAKAGTADQEAKRRLLRMEQRINFLTACLRTAVAMNAAAQSSDTVRFGSTVWVRDHSGSEFEYRIVGVDEIDLNRGWVSWLSPIAKALLNVKVGGSIAFRTPRGEEQLKVVRIG